MSSRKHDSFKDLRKGKYDWKVIARVLNLWRGYTKQGEPFKGFNLLLLDQKKARVHAWVPSTISDEVERIIDVGKIYLFTNFTVKDYENKDRFRCVRKKHQIVFGKDTYITLLNETDVSIEKAWFDFYDLADLEPLANQNVYLTDVVGVMEDHDPIGKIKNKNGIIQPQIKFSITDGRISTKVTFWDEFAELFAEHEQGDLHHPIIIIIGCARVTKWGDDIILTNVGATTYYLNFNHHSVNQLRAMISQPTYNQQNLSRSKNRSYRLYKVKDIQTLNSEHVEKEVFCQVKITNFKEMKTWFYPKCTSCYQQTERAGNVWSCSDCPRNVPYPYKSFQIYTIASDESGDIEIMLEDREVRTLIGKSVYEILDEGHQEDIFPAILSTIKDKEYTIKLLITDLNIQAKNEVYVATDIMEGFVINRGDDQQQSIPHPIESLGPEISSSSYHPGSSSIHLGSDC